MSLERMDDFFNARSGNYDTRQVQNLEEGAACYQILARFLPEHTETLLDLGCGTGLELEAIFARFPRLAFTGIDLAQQMLEKLREKYAAKNITLRYGSYFDVPLGGPYDAAVNVESFHHFTHEEKRGLFARIARCLKPDGVFLDCDYMVANDDEAIEREFFAERQRLVEEAGLPEGFYHYDTPCTVANETRLLREAGFAQVTRAWEAGNTVLLVAKPQAGE